MIRYDMEWNDALGTGGSYEMTVYALGNWVRYGDAMKEIQKLQKELDDIRSQHPILFA
jgi:hypothetical protein